MKKIRTAFKKDPVLYISGILAIISAFLVPPDTAYFSYIDFRVLALPANRLFSEAGRICTVQNGKYKAAGGRPCIPVFFYEHAYYE